MSQTGVVAETRSGGGRDLVFPEMTANEARALTDQIKYDAEALWDKIAAAYTGRAWAALGYESWDVYCIKEFGDMRLRLLREERAEMVCSLRQAGLSIRAIASGVGISDQTVQRDLAAGVVNHYTSPEEPDVVDAELVDEPTPTITGTDGKTTGDRLLDVPGV
jgi:hypothetical protein